MSSLLILEPEHCFGGWEGSRGGEREMEERERERCREEWRRWREMEWSTAGEVASVGVERQKQKGGGRQGTREQSDGDGKRQRESICQLSCIPLSPLLLQLGGCLCLSSGLCRLPACSSDKTNCQCHWNSLYTHTHTHQASSQLAQVWRGGEESQTVDGFSIWNYKHPPCFSFLPFSFE